MGGDLVLGDGPIALRDRPGRAVGTELRGIVLRGGDGLVHRGVLQGTEQTLAGILAGIIPERLNLAMGMTRTCISRLSRLPPVWRSARRLDRRNQDFREMIFDRACLTEVINQREPTGVDESFATAPKGLERTDERHPAGWDLVRKSAGPGHNLAMVAALSPGDGPV